MTCESRPDIGKGDAHIGKGLASSRFEFRQAAHIFGDGALRSGFEPAPAPTAFRDIPQIRTVHGLAIQTISNAGHCSGRGLDQILVFRASIEQEAVYALRQKKHQRDDKQKLADQTTGPKTLHSDFTSPASI